jgi:hypothetical protein
MDWMRLGIGDRHGLLHIRGQANQAWNHVKRRAAGSAALERGPVRISFGD